MKKVLALVLSLATAASMAVSSFAADVTYTTINLKAGDFKTATTSLLKFDDIDSTTVTIKSVVDSEGTDVSADFDATEVVTDDGKTPPVVTGIGIKLIKMTPKKDVTITVEAQDTANPATTYTATYTIKAKTNNTNSGIIDVTKPAAGQFGNVYGTDDNQLLPGNTYGYYIPDETQVRMDDKSIVSATWSVGGAMVDSYKIKHNSTDGYYFSLTLKENYTMVDLKDLKGTITFKKLDADHKGTSTGYTFENATVANDFDSTWKGYSNKDDAEDDIHTVSDNTVYEIDGSGWVCFGDEGRLIQVLAKFSDGQKIFAYFNEKSIDAVLDKYDNGEADIDFIKFPAKPSLKKTSTVTFDRGFSSKGYIYEWANGKLNTIKGAKWDAEDGTWTIETDHLGDYVFSDKALVSETSSSSEEESSSANSSTTEPNPGTGASDFVGLAVALAVVSVAGIAVAKRK